MSEKETKFPSEVIDLPSEGKLYPKDSPLHSGKIEIKYMTAREEDILTSQNLIKKGVVIDRLLDSLIVTKGIKSSDFVIGDKNAVMVAARILAYGPEYSVEITDPNTDEKFEHTFNLTECEFEKLPKGVDKNEFEVELPISKMSLVFKLLTGKEEYLIEREIKSQQKLNREVSSEMTTRLVHSIISIDGETEKPKIRNYVYNMLSRDSLFLRNKINEVSPDIDLTQDIEMGGELVTVDIPLTTEFFWPSS